MDQRLDSADRTGREVQLRLIVNAKLIVPERCAQFSDECETREVGVIVSRAVVGDIASVFLGGGERHARTAKQTVEVDARHDARCTDARFEAQLDAADRDRIADHGEQLPCQRLDVVLGEGRQEQTELVLTETRQGLLRERFTAPFRDGDQQLVAHIGPHRCVDLVKAIEVEQQQRPEEMLASHPPADRAPKAFPVQQASQVVVARHPVEFVHVAT